MAKKKRFTIILPEEKVAAQIIIDYGKAVSKGIGAYPVYYAAPSPPLKDLDDALEALETANVPEGDMSDNLRKILKEKKRIALNVLDDLATYVIGVAKGDRYIASLSNFQLSKEETTSPTQEDFIVKEKTPTSNDGEVFIRLSGRGGHDMFIVELKLPDGNWRMIGGYTLTSFKLKKLPSGSSIIRITGFKSDVPGKSVETVVKAV